MAEQAEATQNQSGSQETGIKNLKEKAADFAGSSTEAIKEQAAEFVDAAKDAGSQAADRLKEGMNSQKDAGARYANGIAEAMRRAAREFDNDLPIAGTYLRRGASQVEAISDRIRKGDFNDLLHDAQDFARQRPTAFLGLAVLAGFGAVRFLKSSAQHPSGGESDWAGSKREETNLQGY